MSENCCKLKYTSIFNSLNYNEEDIVFKAPLESLAPFKPENSGLWKPLFYTQKISQNGSFWFNETSPSVPFTEKGVVNTVPSGRYKDYIGIQDFITINNITLKDWNITNGQYIIDLIPSLSDSYDVVQYQLETLGMGSSQASGVPREALLFWYRYYDIGREQDKRILPGLEIYISDTDCYKANVSGTDYFFLNDGNKVGGDINLVASALTSIGISDADNKAKILATGPQFDWITEILSSGRIVDFNPTGVNDPTASLKQNGIVLPPTAGRNEYGLDSEKLKHMSMRTYRNVGLSNFVLSKKDLVTRLRQKYGGALTVSPSQTTVLESKFKSATGPNIHIRTSGIVQIKQQALNYCNINYTVGPLSFKTEMVKTASQYDLTYAEGLDIFWSGYPQNDPSGPVPTKKQDTLAIFKASLNDTSVSHYYVPNASGLMDPSITSIDYHGLGGVNVEGSQNLDGTYFIPNFSSDVLETNPTSIRLEWKTSNNARYKLSDWILIDYLRTESKSVCKPFISYAANNICNCSRFKALDPTSSTYDLTTHFYVPDISLYYLPSGIFYGGLSGTEVSKYPMISGHPAPGTPFPKNRKITKDYDGLSDYSLNCDYSMNGNSSGTYSFRIPTVGKIFLNYIGTNSRFGILWNGQQKFSTSGENIFSSTNGRICLDKNTIEPQQVDISIGVSGTGLNAPGLQSTWGWHLDFQPYEYLKDQFADRVLFTGLKGFFHPNSGWVSGVAYTNSSYYNKSPLTPYRFKNTNVSDNKKHARINYNANYMYNNEYISGYNYLIDVSGLSFHERNIFETNKYLGIKINNTNSYLVTPSYTTFNYTIEDSPVLEQIPFYYHNLYYPDASGSTDTYPLGDFKYSIADSGNKKLKVYSNRLFNDRMTTLFDVPSLNNNKETIIIKNLSGIDVSFKITAVSGSAGSTFITIDPPLDTGIMPVEGSFHKVDKSLLIYQPIETRNDKNIGLGKWGNILIYPLFRKFVSNNSEYNHSYIRNNLTSLQNTSSLLSWSAPFRLTDSSNTNPIYWNPKAYIEINNSGYSPSGFKISTFWTSTTPSFNNVLSSGNHVISDCKPSFNQQLSLPIYLGSNIGLHKVVVNLTKFNKNGNIQLFYNNQIVDTQTIDGSGNKPSVAVSGISPIWDPSKQQVELSFTKNTNLPIWGEIIINNDVKDCYSNKQPSFIENAVSYLDGKAIDFAKQNRITYYNHHDKSLDNKKVSSRDLLPYLDIHLFGTDVDSKLANIPISGLVSFENALTLKNNTYLSKMSTPYDGSKYWFDVSAKNHWGVLTEKNILLLPHITYTATKSIKYVCDTNTSQCSSRYSNDVCNTVYDLTFTDLLSSLGLNGVTDTDIFDVKIRSYPTDCNSITECCLTADSGCRTVQSGIIKTCNTSYSGMITCKDYTCPPNNKSITGYYSFTKEVYEFKIKDYLSTQYFTDNTQIALFNNLSGYNLTFETANNNNIISIFNHIVNLDNASLLPKISNITTDTHVINNRVLNINNKLCSMNNAKSSNELFKYIYNQTGIVPLSTGQHFYNETVYRRNIPHPNKIHEPFFEYDPKADHDDTETIYTLTFGLKQCTSNNQKIANINLNSVIDMNIEFVVNSGYPHFLITCNGKSKKLDLSNNYNIGSINIISETWPVNTSGCEHNYSIYYLQRYINYISIKNSYNISIGPYYGEYSWEIRNALGAYLPETGPVDCGTVESSMKQAMNAIYPNKNIKLISCAAKYTMDIIATQNCILPCQNTLYFYDDNPPSQKQLDDYAASCPDADDSKQINFSYYDWKQQGAPWSAIKRTGHIKMKNNYNLHYGKNKLTQVKGGKKEKLETTFRVDGCIQNSVPQNDVRNCCEGYDLPLSPYPLSVSIKKYKNFYFINLDYFPNNDSYASNIAFCEPIDQATYFECPKIKVSLGNNVFFHDSLSSKVYNCTRGKLS